MMLGVYDYTVVLTYVSVLISMGGMLFSMNGYPRMAIVCLALSGFSACLVGSEMCIRDRFWCGSDIDRISYGNEPWYRSYDSDVLCAGRTDPSGMV